MSKVPTWRLVDPLGEALHFLRMEGVFYSQCDFAGDWGLSLPALDNYLMFHAITFGTCRLETPGIPACTLRAGDFVVLPHGQGHNLLSQANVECIPLFDLTRQVISERFELIRLGEGDTSARMICGAVRFDHPTGRALVSMLPALIHMDAIYSTSDWMDDILRFMASEVKTLNPGGEAVVTRLADILVIQAIRAWIANSPDTGIGWLGALKDKQIGRALMLMQKQPERAWTLASLASEVAMSRSAFAERFTTLVGDSAMQYLTKWRMQVAHIMLKEQNISVADLAMKVGYQSEAAFNRTFKRITGLTPGAVRRDKDRDASPVEIRRI
jgi:AraC-like DNA-binding protein